MAKKRKTPTTAKSPPPSAPPLSKENNRKEGWWRRLVQHPTTVSLLLLVVAALGQRWFTELGENTKLKSQLERVEEREKKQISENAQLRQDLKDARKKSEELQQLHPLLKFYEYGTRAKLVASYDLKKEVGAQISVGKCPLAPCLIFRINAIRKMHKTGIDYASLSIGGLWEGTPFPVGAFSFGMPLKKGCKTNIRVSVYEVDFVIEDDRIWNVKAGIGISSTSSLQEGIRTGEVACPEEENIR